MLFLSTQAPLVAVYIKDYVTADVVTNSQCMEIFNRLKHDETIRQLIDT